MNSRGRGFESRQVPFFLSGLPRRPRIGVFPPRSVAALLRSSVQTPMATSSALDPLGRLIGPPTAACNRRLPSSLCRCAPPLLAALTYCVSRGGSALGVDLGLYPLRLIRGRKGNRSHVGSTPTSPTNSCCGRQVATPSGSQPGDRGFESRPQFHFSGPKATAYRGCRTGDRLHQYARSTIRPLFAAVGNWKAPWFSPRVLRVRIPSAVPSLATRPIAGSQGGTAGS